MSNVFGVLTSLEAIVRLAHEKGVPVLAYGTQAVVHHAIDVSALDVDFYALTGHKLYGPPGTGKTTLARMLAEYADAAFEELSAVEAGSAEVRERSAERRVREGGGSTCRTRGTAYHYKHKI